MPSDFSQAQQRRMRGGVRRYDNDHRPRTFETYRDGVLAVGIKAKKGHTINFLLYCSSQLVATLTLTPLRNGECEVGLLSGETQCFDFAGMQFDQLQLKAVPADALEKPDDAPRPFNPTDVMVVAGE